SGAIVESAVIVDNSEVGGTFNITVSEVAAILDAISAGLLWELIDDSQNANWQTLNNAQTANWTPITN
ncbi:MAG: hypothetical protein EBS18_06515, partial [Actinobacteria bacterium]|nr:hypothetical protein [Actinomycetota bacterium]